MPRHFHTLCCETKKHIRNIHLKAQAPTYSNHPRRLPTALAFVAIASCLSTANVFAQLIYWTDEGFDVIRSGSINGSSPPTTLFDSSDGLDDPRGIVVDRVGGTLYWANSTASEIQSGNIDGSGAPTDLFDSSDGVALPRRIDIDLINSRVYWVEESGDIKVGNIDGTGSPTLLFNIGPPGFVNALDIELDVPSGRIYYLAATTIGVGNIDGSGIPTTLFSFSFIGPGGIALDTVNGKIFWALPLGQLIQMGNIDGSGTPTTLFNTSASSGVPYELALDIPGGLIYWTKSLTLGAIKVGNIDGSGSPTTLYDSSTLGVIGFVGRGIALPQRPVAAMPAAGAHILLLCALVLLACTAFILRRARKATPPE